MSIYWLLVIGITAAAIYFAGLVSYRLNLSLKEFRRHQGQLQDNLKQLEKPIERDYAKAVPSSTVPATQVLAKRKQFLDAKERKASERRRRLVERLQTIDLDKR